LKRPTIAAAVVLALVLVVAAAASTRLPRLSVCGNGSTLRPDYVLLGCGDGGQFLTIVRWSSWTGRSALGSAVWWQNLCAPNCAAGTFRRERVRITLSRPRPCRKPAATLFTRMTLRGERSRPTVVKIPYSGGTRCP